MRRSILAVVVGFVVIAGLSIGTDAAVHAILPDSFGADGRVDSAAVLLLFIGYVGLFATFGCWLCGRMAPSHPLRHALILGGLGFAFNLVGTVAYWSLMPAWYHIANLSLVMVWAWIGGSMAQAQLERRTGSVAEPPAALHA